MMLACPRAGSISSFKKGGTIPVAGILWRRKLNVGWLMTATLAGLLVAATGGGFTGPASDWFGTGHRAQAADVSVELTGSQFSISRSILKLQVSSLLPPPKNGGLPVVLNPGSIAISGVEDLRPVHLAFTSLVGPQTVEFGIEAGPPQPGAVSVRISVGSVFVMTEDSAKEVAGPWQYQVGVDRPDLWGSSQVIAVNRSVGAGGILVHVSEARVTTDEVLVTHSLTGPAGYGGPIGSGARMILASGEVIDGRVLQTRRNATGDLAVSFPALPPGTKQFDLKFGAFALAMPGVGVGVDIPPDSPVLSGAGTLQVGKTIATSAGEITLAAVQASSGGFAVQFSGQPARGLTAAISPDARVAATRGDGVQTQQASSVIVYFGRNPDGTPYFKEATAEFPVQLGRDWTRLDLTVDRLWLLVELAEPIRVSLP